MNIIELEEKLKALNEKYVKNYEIWKNKSLSASNTYLTEMNNLKTEMETLTEENFVKILL